MKRIILGLMLAMACCTLAQGKQKTVIENVGEDNKRRIIELQETIVDGKVQMDTLSIMTYEDSAEEVADQDDGRSKRRQHSESWSWSGFDLDSNTVVAITAIVFIFGLPLLIVLVVFFFRYKNRKAKYRLAEQALASGQQLPENFFKETMTDSRTKGISNIFSGIGLFIFLWAITGKFSLGCIGLLIMFTGFGQLVIYYTQQSKDGSPFIRIENDKHGGKSNIKVGGAEISNREKKNEE